MFNIKNKNSFLIKNSTEKPCTYFDLNQNQDFHIKAVKEFK